MHWGIDELMEQVVNEVNISSSRYAMRRTEGKGRIRPQSKDVVLAHVRWVGKPGLMNTLENEKGLQANPSSPVTL
jgi:hypothetical protein